MLSLSTKASQIVDGLSPDKAEEVPSSPRLLLLKALHLQHTRCLPAVAAVKPRPLVVIAAEVDVGWRGKNLLAKPLTV